MLIHHMQSVFCFKCNIEPKFPLARLQSESVGIRLIQQHIYESEEVQTDERFVSLCV